MAAYLPIELVTTMAKLSHSFLHTDLSNRLMASAARYIGQDSLSKERWAG